MKILIAGEWRSAMHEAAVAKAITQLGHETLRFSWHDYFIPPVELAWLTRPAYKFQNKFLVGPLLNRLNVGLVELVEKSQPDVVLVYRGSHIYPTTLRKLKHVNPRGLLVGYNNDDPFSPDYPQWVWRHFLRGIPDYDLMLAFRCRNIEEFLNAGAKRARLLRFWFRPERHHPVALSDEENRQYECDVAFIGHYEPDGRLEALEAVAAAGFRVRVFGPYKGLGKSGWFGRIDNSPLLKSNTPMAYLADEEYVKAICGAKIALCFFSKLNRDTYTARCFEIPACGTALFSEYSDDIASLFEEGVDAEFFRSKEQLVEKITSYMKNPTKLEMLTRSGTRRVRRDGHDVISRMSELLKVISKLRDK